MQNNIQSAYIVNQLTAAINSLPGDQSHLDPDEAELVIEALVEHREVFKQALAVFERNNSFEEMINVIFDRDDDDLLDHFYRRMLDQNSTAASAAGITAAYINQYV